VSADIWNISAAKKQITIEISHPQPGAIWGMAFTPDSRRLAITPYGNGPVKLWDATTGNDVLTLRETIAIGTSHPPAFSPDGAAVVAAGEVIETGTGRRAFAPPGGIETKGTAVDLGGWRFSPDGKSLAVMSGKHEVVVLDAKSGSRLRVFGGHTGLTSLAYSPDGARLAVGCQNGSIKLLNAQTGAESFRIRGHASAVVGLTFSADGTRLFAADKDQTKLWDVTRPPDCLALPTDATQYHTVSFSPDGALVASPSGTRKFGKAKPGVIVWDAGTGEERCRLPHAEEIYEVAISPCSRLLAAAGKGGVTVWSLSDRTELRKLKTGSWADRLAFSPDGTRLAAAHVSGFTTFDTATWEVVRSITTSTKTTGWVTSLSYSRDGNQIITGRYGSPVQIWDSASGAEVTCTGRAEHYTTALLTRDHRQLITCGGGKEATVWAVGSDSPVRHFRGHEGAVYGAALNPDETRLVTGSADGTVKLWNATTGEEILSLAGHNGPVWAVVWSTDGRRIASASGDGTVRVWEAPPRK